MTPADYLNIEVDNQIDKSSAAASSIGKYVASTSDDSNWGMYRGNFVEGLRCGYGQMKLPRSCSLYTSITALQALAGATYSGQWDNDQPNGRGCLLLVDNSKIYGEWKSGILCKIVPPLPVDIDKEKSKYKQPYSCHVHCNTTEEEWKDDTLSSISHSILISSDETVITTSDRTDDDDNEDHNSDFLMGKKMQLQSYMYASTETTLVNDIITHENNIMRV